VKISAASAAGTISINGGVTSRSIRSSSSSGGWRNRMSSWRSDAPQPRNTRPAARSTAPPVRIEEITNTAGSHG
jgi:hypothetical protein